MTKTKKIKRIRDTWTTGIMPDPCDDGRFHSLVINRVDKKKFNLGDKVRVTVSLIEPASSSKRIKSSSLCEK
jgi:hypothetical protein